MQTIAIIVLKIESGSRNLFNIDAIFKNVFKLLSFLEYSLAYFMSFSIIVFPKRAVDSYILTCNIFWSQNINKMLIMGTEVSIAKEIVSNDDKEFLSEIIVKKERNIPLIVKTAPRKVSDELFKISTRRESESLISFSSVFSSMYIK